MALLMHQALEADAFGDRFAGGASGSVSDHRHGERAR